MSKIDKNGLSLYQLKIFEICKSIYKNELFINDHFDNQEYRGYLIEADKIMKIYEKLKPIIVKYFEDNTIYKELKKHIKDKKEQLTDIISKKFNNSSELIKELNNDKKFYLIKQEYLYLKEDDLKGKEIKFMFIKDKIMLIFGDSDLLTFSLKKNGTIEKPFFINNSDVQAINSVKSFLIIHKDVT